MTKFMKKSGVCAGNSGTPSDDLIGELMMLTDQFNPDIGYPAWISVLMILFNETGGAMIGLDLADDWSARGNKYKGRKEIERHWKGFKSNHRKPLTMATLYWMIDNKPEYLL